MTLTAKLFSILSLYIPSVPQWTDVTLGALPWYNSKQSNGLAERTLGNAADFSTSSLLRYHSEISAIKLLILRRGWLTDFLFCWRWLTDFDAGILTTRPGNRQTPTVFANKPLTTKYLFSLFFVYMLTPDSFKFMHVSVLGLLPLKLKEIQH